MTQWAEIRHLHLSEGVPKKEIARRFGLDVKTVRRAIAQETRDEKRKSPRRGRLLDPHRAEIAKLLVDGPTITAKRIRRLLEGKLGDVSPRTVRKYVAELRRETHPRECFVHRTHAAGKTMEVDFGTTWATIAGKLCRVKYVVCTLPASRAHFAKAYPLERTECLLDGMLSAFKYFGGLTNRVVLDNTSLAVKKVLLGRERIEGQMFHAFRGELALHADFCAPAKGNEKGGVERGVDYTRRNAFTPRPEVASFDELNATIMAELDHDLDFRKLPDGRTAREALFEEKTQLRALPLHAVETCRVVTAVADKYAHIRVDCATYSIPSRFVRRPVEVKLYHDRLIISAGCEKIAEHVRSFERGALVLSAEHILGVLECKHRAIAESTAIADWELPEALLELREELAGAVHKSDREWVQVLRLTETYSMSKVEWATRESLDRHSPRLETIQQLLRQDAGEELTILPLPLEHPVWSAVTVADPDLSIWDQLLRVEA